MHRFRRSTATHRQTGIALNENPNARYRIIERIGFGGLGTVYKAWDKLKERKVAIKVPNSDIVVFDAFKKEMRHARTVSHPNIVEVFDSGDDINSVVEVDSFPPRCPYIVMELMDHTSTLGDKTYPQCLSVREVIRISMQIARALFAVHCNGIVHRDIKPENVFLEEDPYSGKIIVKLSDFGIATEMEEESAESGLVMGTPWYMSPENIRGEPLDPRSDVYSLGAVIFEMLTGEGVFNGLSEEITSQHLLYQPRTPSVVAQFHSDIRIPTVLDMLVLRALSKKPEKRQANMAQLTLELNLCMLAI